MSVKTQNNTNLLNQVNNSNSWLHYRKTKPLWAKRLKEAETVNTLEGKVTYKQGDYLCKGPSGDIWGQKAESLFKKYDPAPDAKTNNEGWQEFIPKLDASGVMAASINFDFSVEHPAWGTFYGKAGSYLIKNYQDKENTYPEDIWIVKKEIFESTYERVI